MSGEDCGWVGVHPGIVLSPQRAFPSDACSHGISLAVLLALTYNFTILEKLAEMADVIMSLPNLGMTRL